MDKFVTHLRKHNLRVTAPRRAVFQALKSAGNTLSLSQIITTCSDIDRSSIYRTLDTCISIGAIKVIPVGWKKRYELTDLFTPHHHHMICLGCEKTIPISESDVKHFVNTIAAKYHFTPTSHQFEIDGYCQSCQK